MDKQSSNTISRRSLLKLAGAGLAASASGLAVPAIGQTRQLTIITERSNANTRAAFAQIAAAFEREAGATVTINNMDHEAHKTAIWNYLVASPPDVCFWFTGNRMRAFVKRGLFDDISDLVARENYKDVLGMNLESVTVDGKQWGLPTHGIFWGLYYRKDVFAQYGLPLPGTFEELKAMAAKAKAAGLTPFTIGTEEMWPAASWFETLNLRINGLDKHLALMEGQMSYLDPALAPVFDRWEELIKPGYFLPNSTSYGWQQAATFLVQRTAAMFQLGNFVTGAFPVEEREQVGVIPMPEIVPGVGPYEDVSFNSVHIPSGAKNKDLAREFLAYFYKPENLAAFLAPEDAVSPCKDVQAMKTPLMQAIQEILQRTKDTVQFYDRDTDPDMAQVGLNGFQEFMAAPDRRQSVLQRMEATRKRIFKA
jgi:multiple sugar transport system substrate-binding protein